MVGLRLLKGGRKKSSEPEGPFTCILVFPERKRLTFSRDVAVLYLKPSESDPEHITVGLHACRVTPYDLLVMCDAFVTYVRGIASELSPDFLEEVKRETEGGLDWLDSGSRLAGGEL